MGNILVYSVESIPPPPPKNKGGDHILNDREIKSEETNTTICYVTIISAVFEILVDIKKYRLTVRHPVTLEYS